MEYYVFDALTMPSRHGQPAPVAQWIRALASGAKGHRFESCRAYRRGGYMLYPPLLYVRTLRSCRVCSRIEANSKELTAKQAVPQVPNPFREVCTSLLYVLADPNLASSPGELACRNEFRAVKLASSTVLEDESARRLASCSKSSRHLLIGRSLNEPAKSSRPCPQATNPAFCESRVAILS